jgi:6-phosphogluconolactonase
MGSAPRIEAVEDAEALAARALDLFVSEARTALRSRGKFNVAISGGHTPERFFELLGQSGASRSLAWDRIHVFWSDERCVLPDHPDSNYGLAARTFLTTVRLPESNIHRVRTELETPCDAVRDYEQTLRQAFAIREGRVPSFDMIFLGMGPDGHTASLFPYCHAVMDMEHVAGIVCRPQGPARVTLMPQVLRAARRNVVLIGGSDKAETLKTVLAAEADPLRYPIHVLWPALDRVLWLVDAEALSLYSGPR